MIEEEWKPMRIARPFVCIAGSALVASEISLGLLKQQRRNRLPSLKINAFGHSAVEAKPRISTSWKCLGQTELESQPSSSTLGGLQSESPANEGKGLDETGLHV
jgi:hypothetical protein